MRDLKFSELLAEYMRMRSVEFDPLRHRSIETIRADERRMARLEDEMDRRVEGVTDFA